MSQCNTCRHSYDGGCILPKKSQHDPPDCELWEDNGMSPEVRAAAETIVKAARKQLYGEES